jgi:hypothetical protein
MVYSDDIKKIGQSWVYYVEILPRTCSNVYGVAPCTASGGQCAYSWATCEDPANFVLTTTTFKFSSKEGTKIFEGTQVQPTLVSVSDLPTEIDPNKSVTINARVQLTFEDVKDPPPLHSDKGTGKFHAYRNSTFWRIFTRIYRESYKYCILRLYEGLPSYTQLSDFSLRRELKVNNIEFVSGGKVRVAATDKTRVAKNIKIPNAISSSNVTTAIVTQGAATIPVTDGSEFRDFPKLRGAAKIIDNVAGDEYVQFQGISGNNLTTVTRGLYGTSDVEHAAGVKVIQVAAFAQNDDIGISTDRGVNPVFFLEELILGEWLGIDTSDIDSSQFNNEETIWYSSLRYRRIIESPISADKLISQLCQFMMANVWQDETQKITFKGFHPTPPGVTLSEFKTNENILDNSVKINNKIETQISRVTVHFSPNDTWGTKDHTSEDDFTDHLVWINAAAENDNGQGDLVEKEFFADWIFKLQDAKSFANRYIRRYSPTAPAELNFEVYRRDAETETGDIIELTSDQFVDDDGTDATLKFQVLAKSESQRGVIKMKALETKFVLKYAFISPAGWPDWTAATAAQKEYGYIADVDSAGVAEMSDGSPASYIW